MIRVVADENIPGITRALPEAVELTLAPGRAIDAEAVRNADALLVRSVTRVDKALLNGSHVRFVGSATAGLDHVDEAWLGREGIAFAWAPGSNAESVAEYVAAALLHIAAVRNLELEGLSIGIVGVGQCGSRVERVARALGMRPLLCDPPLAAREPSDRFLDLKDLASADVVTMHVPLTRSGPYRTEGLISKSFIQSMHPGAVLINASRGGVVDEAALIKALKDGRLGGAVIDAWVGEPRVDRALLELGMVTTPHIAGYSTDGKYRGTEMIAGRLCQHFELQSTWSPSDELELIAKRLTMPKGSLTRAMGELVSDAYPIQRDSDALRSALELDPDRAAAQFDALRKQYPIRREFSAYAVEGSGPVELTAAARELGFRIS